MYDLVIIGAGPAGLTASIYASRYRLKNLIIGKLLGGTITWAHKVENFPGFTSISGFELGQKMKEQVKSLGAEIISEEVQKILKEANGFKVMTFSGKVFLSKSLILATGTQRRKLGIPGEEEYLGKGVSYCTTCDAPFFKDKTLVLVGGSNAACSGAVHLTEYAKKVFLVYRKSQLRAEPAWVEEVKNQPKIEIVYETNLVEILGDGQKVTGIKFDQPYQGKTNLAAEGVFIEIGGEPTAALVKNLGVEFDEGGYLVVNERMETDLSGLFAAGDVTNKSKKIAQAVIASAQGAQAALSAYEYLKSKKLGENLITKK